MRAPKWLCRLFENPKKRLAALLPELALLRDKLISISQRMKKDAFGELVNFFNLTSPWHDRIGEIQELIAAFEGVNYGQHTETIQALRTLEAHLVNAGRNEFGWNRTKPGQMVTKSDVYLGNIYGLWTFPIPRWEETSTKRPAIWSHLMASEGMDGMSPYDVVSRQALQFMESHLESIIIALVRLVPWRREAA